MSRRQQHDIRRQYKQGSTYKWLCATYGITQSELKKILAEPRAPKLSAEEQRQKAIRELKDEGFTAEQIAAVFGE